MKHYDDPQDTVLRGALVPFGVISVASLIGWSIGKGGHAAIGVAVAIALVGLFFYSGFYIEKRVREVHPMAAMGAAMASFALKFLVLGGLLVALRDTDLFDTDAFGITAIALAIGWLGGEVRAFTKARFLYVLTDAASTSQPASNPSDED